MDKVRAEFESFLNTYNVKDSAVARAIGVSPTAISLFKKGTYKGKNEELALKISKYIRNYKKEDKKGEEFYKSKDVKMAFFTMSDAVEDKEIGLIYGEAGTGKTWIAKEFAKENPNVILIEADLYVTAKSMLEDIAEALKITVPNSLHGKLKEVARHLVTADKVIVVDEAEHLPYRALEGLRRIHDFSRTPVILVGTEILLGNLQGKNRELKQLYSRIGGKWVMGGLNKDECKEVFGAYIYKWTNGNFRASSKLKRRAKRLADIEKCEVNEQIVSLAAEMIVL